MPAGYYPGNFALIRVFPISARMISQVMHPRERINRNNLPGYSVPYEMATAATAADNIIKMDPVIIFFIRMGVESFLNRVLPSMMPQMIAAATVRGNIIDKTFTVMRRWNPID